MEFKFLDKEEYKHIPLYKLKLDGVEDIPTFLSRYKTKNLPLPWHRHEYMQINYVYQGKMKHVINNHEFEVIKGDIFVIPPYVPHRLIDAEQDDGIIYEFEFMPEFINQNFTSIENIKTFFDFAYIEPFLVSENQIKPRLNLSGKVQMEVEGILNEALNEYTKKENGYGLLIKSLLLKLLVLVGREFTKGLNKPDSSDAIFSRHRDAIYNAIEYINQNYNKSLSIEDVAKVSMVSQSYFSYLFKSITSKTFVEYLNGLRISQAMELLKTTNNRVLDICYEVGFNNVNHFNKLFRQQTGVSPLYYRKNVK